MGRLVCGRTIFRAIEASSVGWRRSKNHERSGDGRRRTRGVVRRRSCEALEALGDAWLGRQTPGKAWWHEVLTTAMSRPVGRDPDPPAGVDELTVLVSDAPEVVRELAAAKYGGDGDPWRWLGRRLGEEIRAGAMWYDGFHGRRSWWRGQMPYVVPLPSPWWRRCHRGMDHTALLAIEVAASIRGRRRHWLSRRWGPPQVGSGRRARQQVAAQVTVGPMRWIEERLRGRRRWDHDIPVLLVDDIVTTGASLSACARVLRSAGHRTVVAAVIAAHQGSIVDDLSTVDPLNWMRI
jgi:predicted amidophosphoribosyltransferase